MGSDIRVIAYVLFYSVVKVWNALSEVQNCRLTIISRPYLSNGQAIGMVVVFVRPSVRLSVCNGYTLSNG